MSNKRKKRASKKSQRNQRAHGSALDFNISLYIAEHLERTTAIGGINRAELVKIVNDYFWAYPHRTGVTIKEIAEYAMLRANFSTGSPLPSSHNESSTALTPSPSSIEANETNNQETPSAESKLLEPSPEAEVLSLPPFGERLLLLILTKQERVNIPGDLEEEFKEIAAKHGARYAKLWYYKQVAASAWPLARKAVGWGLLASVGAWLKGRL